MHQHACPGHPGCSDSACWVICFKTLPPTGTMGYERQRNRTRLFLRLHPRYPPVSCFFGFNGWYTGMQNAVILMCIAATVNIVRFVSRACGPYSIRWASRASLAARSAQNTGSCWRSCCLSCDTANSPSRFTMAGSGGLGTGAEIFPHQPRHHRPYALYRSRIYLHGGIGPWRRTDPADGQYASPRYLPFSPT